jgi:hypothetical protein
MHFRGVVESIDYRRWSCEEGARIVTGWCIDVQLKDEKLGWGMCFEIDKQGLTSLDMAYRITDKCMWIAEPTAATRNAWLLWLIRYLANTSAGIRSCGPISSLILQFYDRIILRAPAK